MASGARASRACTASPKKGVIRRAYSTGSRGEKTCFFAHMFGHKPSPMRYESDDLGTLTLDDDTPYGVRTARIVRHLGVSGRTLADYPAFVVALCIVKRAAARANALCGVLDEDRLTKLERAACEIEEVANAGGDQAREAF